MAEKPEIIIPPGSTLVDTFTQTFDTVPVDAEQGNAIATSEFIKACRELLKIFGRQLRRVPIGLGPSSDTLLQRFTTTVAWTSSRVTSRPTLQFVSPPTGWLRQHKRHRSLDRMTYSLLRPQKVENRLKAAPQESETLQSLVRNELKSKSHTATEGLLWLTRCVGGLHKSHAVTRGYNWPISSRGLEFICKAIQESLQKPDETMPKSFRAGYGASLEKHHGFFAKPLVTTALLLVPSREVFYGKLGSDTEMVKEHMETYVKGLQKIVDILLNFMSSKEAKW
jgi:hypothetical protein